MHFNIIQSNRSLPDYIAVDWVSKKISVQSGVNFTVETYNHISIANQLAETGISSELYLIVKHSSIFRNYIFNSVFIENFYSMPPLLKKMKKKICLIWNNTVLFFYAQFQWYSFGVVTVDRERAIDTAE